jgi:hypothetical protein
MNLDSEYYSRPDVMRHKWDINGLWVFKGTFMTFVGVDSDHYTVFYSKIKELFTVFWVGRCSENAVSKFETLHTSPQNIK